MKTTAKPILPRPVLLALFVLAALFVLLGLAPADVKALEYRNQMSNGGYFTAAKLDAIINYNEFNAAKPIEVTDGGDDDFSSLDLKGRNITLDLTEYQVNWTNAITITDSVGSGSLTVIANTAKDPGSLTIKKTLTVDGATFIQDGHGQITINTDTGDGLVAENGAKVTVHSVTSANGTGVKAEDADTEVNIITSTAGGECGISATTQATVNGATASATNGAGVIADSFATITLAEDVTGELAGAEARNNSTITIAGNVTAAGDGLIIQDQGNITVDGSVAADKGSYVLFKWTATSATFPFDQADGQIGTGVNRGFLVYESSSFDWQNYSARIKSPTSGTYKYRDINGDDAYTDNLATAIKHAQEDPATNKLTIMVTGNNDDTTNDVDLGDKDYILELDGRALTWDNPVTLTSSKYQGPYGTLTVQDSGGSGGLTATSTLKVAKVDFSQAIDGLIIINTSADNNNGLAANNAKVNVTRVTATGVDAIGIKTDYSTITVSEGVTGVLYGIDANGSTVNVAGDVKAIGAGGTGVRALYFGTVIEIGGDASGDYNGIRAASTAKVKAHNAVGTTFCGVYSEHDGTSVELTRDATGGRRGIYAQSGSRVQAVNAIATNDTGESIGVYAWGISSNKNITTVTLSGNATGGKTGVQTKDCGAAFILGNVNSGGTGLLIQDKGFISVDGTVTYNTSDPAAAYIHFERSETIDDEGAVLPLSQGDGLVGTGDHEGYFVYDEHSEVAIASGEPWSDYFARVRKPNPPTPDPDPNPTPTPSNGSAKTSDDTDLGTWIILAVLSAVALGGFAIKQKKNSSQNHQ